ncbi:flavin reductase family protein [soil metagenome]
MEISADTLHSQQIYKLMTGSIVPRPIAWVSTLSQDGSANVAPFSYFNAVSADPPVLLFSAGLHTADRPKDTLRNVQETGEFVVNIVTESVVEAMNASAVAAPYGVDEFEFAGVTPAPSKRVSAPRVLESPVNFECKVLDIYRVGGDAATNSVVFGEIVHIHVDDELLLDDYKIDPVKLRPVGRLAGTTYSRVRDLFDLRRPVYEETRS